MLTKDINKLKLLYKLGLVDEQVVLQAEETPLINIEDLHVNFKRNGKLFEAVKGVNLKINNGEILGLVGESGSGKTTLGRTIISLWDHALGKVEIDGKQTPEKRIRSVSKDNVWVYKEGQMIYQDPTSSLNRQMKVLDIVNEGQKNFKIIENEQKQLIKEETALIKEADKTIKALESKDSYEKYMKEFYRNNHIIEVVSNSNDKELLELIKDFSDYTNIKEKINILEDKLSNNDKDIKKRIKILNDKRISEKIILSENTQSDKEFIKNSMNNEIAEFNKLKERVVEDKKEVSERIEKRTAKFFKKVIKNAKNLPTSISSKLPKDDKDIKGIKAGIKLLSNEKGLNPAQKLYARSLALSLQVVLKKKEELISPLNTAAYEFIYTYTHELFLDRIHYLNKLLTDLDKRRKGEETKRKGVDDERVIKFYDEGIEYFNEYEEILISLIKEYAGIIIQVKTLLLEHGENGIKHFYSEINQINKLSNELQASIITWKSEEAIKYHKRLKEKNLIVYKQELKQLKSDLSELTKKYNDLENPISDLEKVIKVHLDAFESKYKITDAVYKAEVKKIEKLKEAEEIGKEKIAEAERILKNKKHKREIAISRIKETLLKVGLNEDALNKYPSQFSGGQKQRIGIARTIITKPKFIIADEPISALDVSVQAQVINLLKDIHAEMGLTMLFIAHDLQMVHYISDKIAVIYRGNIVEYGEADKVYKSPIHPYTKSLIGAMPSIGEIGKPLEVSDYKWADHEYNEFSSIKLHEIEKDHYVLGTEEEIKKWK